MRTLLGFLGLGAIGFGFYTYFKNQLALALNYEYKIKKLRVVNVSDSQVEITGEIDIKNNSSFQIELTSYDLKFSLLGQQVATSLSDTPVIINGDSSFKMKVDGTIDLKGTSSVALELMQDIIKREPIKFDVNGFINIKFLNLPYTIEFNDDKFTYSTDVLADSGVSDKVLGVTDKVTALLGKLGIIK
jgi:LEA14-like dessication related protein